jgi:archaeosine-15-forming tRNA-guanine transglycosylase
VTYTTGQVGAKFVLFYASSLSILIKEKEQRLVVSESGKYVQVGQHVVSANIIQI